MRGLKIRLMIGGVVLIVLGVVLMSIKGIHDYYFVLTGVGAVLFVVGLIKA